jgi:hypothetical protein
MPEKSFGLKNGKGENAAEPQVQIAGRKKPTLGVTNVEPMSVEKKSEAAEFEAAGEVARGNKECVCHWFGIQ